jgi:hypothetical protein
MTGSRGWLDGFVLCGAVLFALGCIATAHRPARTLEPGQVSVSGSYLRAENLDDRDATPIQLTSLDVRYGLARGVDAGLVHTWDVTAENDNAFNALWGDLNFQVTNRSNALRRPTLAVGLLKGYIYDPGDEDPLHVTSLPFIVDYPINDAFTPFIFYRYELVRDGFIPERLTEDIRHTFGVGADVDLRRRTSPAWQPKVGVALGRFNSLDGGDGDSGLLLNIGVTINSPLRDQR